MKIQPVALIVLAGLVVSACQRQEARAAAVPETQDPHIVDQHAAVFTAPPKNVPTGFMADGPLLGNGDMAVVMGGPPEEQQFFIGKNDFWGRAFPGVERTADFRDRRSNLVAAAAAAPEPKRLAARCELARFFLARDSNGSTTRRTSRTSTLPRGSSTR